MKFKTDEILDTVIDSDPKGLSFKKGIVENLLFIARSSEDKGIKPVVEMQFRNSQKAIDQYLLYLRDGRKSNPEVEKAVNSPSHYTASKIEVIDVITEVGIGFGFCIGNAIKYLMRAGLKDESKLVEDVKKAKWYIDRASKQFSGELK